MAGKYLLPIYKAVFDEEFNYGDFDKRMKMQKAVYLLEQMGLGIGNYGYIWYKYGPYSQELQDDMYHQSEMNKATLQFSSEAKSGIEMLRKMLNKKENADIKYDIPRWIECIASLYYLKKNVLPSNAQKSQILQELKHRKNYLTDDAANEVAYQCANWIK